MEVILTTDNLLNSSGGQSRSVKDLSHNLIKKNLINRIYTSKNCGINQLNYSFFNSFQKYDLVHNFGVWSFFHIYNYYLSKKSNTPLIVSPLGMMEPWSLKQKEFKKKLAFYLYEKKILNSIKAIHATSKMEADNLRKIGLTNHIEYIPHGIDLKFIEPDYNFKQKISNGRKILLFLSRFDKKKGIYQLIEIFKKINNRGWVLLISSFENQEYFEQKKKNIKNNNIIFFGESNDKIKSKLYSIADFFILPSFSENFGLAIMESLSYKCPVITTNYTPWSFINDISGFIIDDVVDDLEKILRKTFSLSDNDNLHFKKNCHGNLKNFVWDKVICDYINLYRNVINI